MNIQLQRHVERPTEWVKSRESLLSRLKLDGKVCAEVGVQWGHFSKKILSHTPKRLILIDPWCSYQRLVRPDDPLTQEQADKQYSSVCARFAHHPEVEVIRETSLEAVKDIADASMDFVYIDGDHTYKAVLADMRAWWPKIKSGGWLAGHDLVPSIPDSVVKAYKEFRPTIKPAQVIFTNEKWASFAWQRP